MNNLPIFKERVNKENLQYLKKLSHDEIEILCQANLEEKDPDGKPWNYSRIIKGIKSMEVESAVKYKYARRRDSGRMYGTKFSIQALPNNIRTFLTNDRYHDFDLVNAHYQILYKMCRQHDLPRKHIKQYVRHRHDVLVANNMNKLKMIVLLYTDKPPCYMTSTSYLKSLVLEIQSVRNELLNIYNPTSSNTRNPLSSRLCSIICDRENEIVQVVVRYFQLKEVVLMFDGFMCEPRDDITIENLEEITKYRWSRKEHENTIEKEEDVDGREANDYESVKKEFEKHNFMTLDPVAFHRNVGGKWVETTKQDMDLVYMGLEADGKPFFPQWLKDYKHMKRYKSIIWYPVDEREVNGDFNTFRPFNYEYGHTVDGVDLVEIEKFLELLDLLTDDVPSQTDYLTKFLAHLIQKPEENPEMILVFKGLEGCGKDTLLEIIKKLIGEDYVHCEENMNLVCGNFNELRSQKLVLGLNEMEGSDGVKFKSALKHMATAKKQRINKKYGKMYDEANYTRFFAFANSFSPVVVKKGESRRFVIFDTSSDKIGEEHKPWWAYLYKKMKDPYFLQNVFDYLCEVDIDDWIPSQYTETEAKKQMEYLNNNPVYSYLQQVVNNVEKYPTYERVILKGEEYLFAHWSEMADDYEISDFWEKEMKLRDFKKNITGLGSKVVTVKRRGTRDMFAIHLNKVKRALSLRLRECPEVDVVSS